MQARLLRGDFGVVLAAARRRTACSADAILLDLGVSSMQLDRPERGFSYSVDAPLDMRMDTLAGARPRATIVNEWDERELVTIFRRYGEERYAKQIARAIVRRRKEQPFERTGELVDTIKASIPAPARFGEGHPAKRVFQALRIAVNDELGSLEAALPAALEMLRPGGRLAVISFHSLEDRIVKQFLRDKERGCTCPPDFPVCVCGHEPELRAIERRPVRPSEAEIAANPRAASARLRAAMKAGGASMAAVDWFATDVAAPAAPAAVARRRAAARASAPARAGLRLSGGIVWISVFAVLLAGVVALNVAVLRLNMSVGKLDKQQLELQAQNQALASQVSSAGVGAPHRADGAPKLGLVPAPADRHELPRPRRK